MSEPINSFPGYEFIYDPSDNKYHNMYRGVDLGKGGWVYSKPGVYSNVALLDIASLHPHSILALNKLGKYTQRYADLLHARVLIKHKQFDEAKKLFDGKLEKYLESTSEAKALSKALKLPLNAFFGISFATFPNPARDSRDKNNIIALRGALFMKTLFDEVEKRGFHICHVKTDSCKIPNANLEIVQFVQEFARKYGYEMEHEATFDRLCLIDKAQYIGALMPPDRCKEIYGYVPDDNAEQFAQKGHPWTATGDEFQRPFIFKNLFSGEDFEFDDVCITNTVREGSIYMDFNENLPDVTLYEKELKRREHNKENADKKPLRLNPNLSDMTDGELRETIAKGHDYRFIGRVGRFCPVKEGCGGAVLLVLRNGKYDAVAGSKGYRWMEAEALKKADRTDLVNRSYFYEQSDEAQLELEKYDSYDNFIDTSVPYVSPSDKINPPQANEDDDPPWSELPPVVPCGDGKYNTCLECPNCKDDLCKKGYSLASYIEYGGDGK